MEKKVRMADIAKTLGVSIVTVSKALAGKDGVSDAMRQKIQNLAQEMGYQAKNSIKSGIADELRGANVGILIAGRFVTKNNSFYWTLYERVLASLSENCLFSSLELLSWEDEHNLTMPRLVQNNRVQALIVIGRVELSYRHMLWETGLPVVQLDTYHARSELDSVISDGYYGMYMMTDYLIRHGHREIAYLGTIGATSSITDRYFGYCRALQENGIPLEQDRVIADRDEHGTVCFRLPERMPTAFVCNCDSVAYNLIKLLNEKGYRVPEDVSVVGFDDHLFSELSNPRITTYAVDMDGMARASVAQLIRRWKNPGGKPEFQIVPGHLEEKESVRTLELTDK